MKKHLFLLLTLCAVSLCASATTYYVKPNGSNSKDGKSWANAKQTISNALGVATAGDEVLVAQGTYNVQLSLADGVAIKGGYNAETGERNIDEYKTIIDGSGIVPTSYLIVRYLSTGESYPTNPILIEGLVIQNANSSAWGSGTMFLRGNMTVNRCTFRNC